MTRCEKYWNKVRDLLAADDKEGLTKFCEKHPHTLDKIVAHVKYVDQYPDTPMGVLPERATRQLRKMARLEPEKHEEVLELVCEGLAPKDAIRQVERAARPKVEVPSKILHDSIDNILEHVAPETVDLILTDPPYVADGVPLFSILAEKAAQILRPGGFLVTYSGQFYLPEIMKRLTEVKGLEYVWTFALLHKTRHITRARDLSIMWKPIIVLARPPYELPWMSDIIQGTGREKEGHEWQQSLGESEELIERFTVEGDLVVDPFLGSGTVVVAAKKLNRLFFGMDIDEEAIQTTARRLKNEE